MNKYEQIIKKYENAIIKLNEQYNNIKNEQDEKKSELEEEIYIINEELAEICEILGVEQFETVEYEDDNNEYFEFNIINFIESKKKEIKREENYIKYDIDEDLSEEKKYKYIQRSNIKIKILQDEINKIEQYKEDYITLQENREKIKDEINEDSDIFWEKR